MTAPETAMLRSFVGCARRYLEFGSGGSTVLACTLVRDWVRTIDSDQAWLDKVSEACEQANTPLAPQMKPADIGPTGDWGAPSDPQTRARWPDYHSRIWSESDSSDADLILVDGRFRVACCLQSLMRTDRSCIVLVHDFSDRPHYHAIKEFAHEIARAGRLSAFQRLRDFDPEKLAACLGEHNFDTR